MADPKKAKSALTLITTPLAVLSYPHFLHPQPADTEENPNAKDKFAGTFIFLEGTDMEAMRKAAFAAAEEKWPGKAAELFKKGLPAFRSPFRYTDAEEKNYPAGSIFVGARSDTRPGLVYPYAEPGTGKPALVPLDKITEVFYPGAIVRAQLRAFAYDRKGNKGVSFALNHVQFVKDGERLDNRVKAEDAFEATELAETPASLEDLM
jgi:hypothetical protein